MRFNKKFSGYKTNVATVLCLRVFTPHKRKNNARVILAAVLKDNSFLQF
jgi:hypothetical protein